MVSFRNTLLFSRSHTPLRQSWHKPSETLWCTRGFFSALVLSLAINVGATNKVFAEGVSSHGEIYGLITSFASEDSYDYQSILIDRTGKATYCPVHQVCTWGRTGVRLDRWEGDAQHADSNGNAIFTYFGAEGFVRNKFLIGGSVGFNWRNASTDFDERSNTYVARVALYARYGRKKNEQGNNDGLFVSGALSYAWFGGSAKAVVLDKTQQRIELTSDDLGTHQVFASLKSGYDFSFARLQALSIGPFASGTVGEIFRSSMNASASGVDSQIYKIDAANFLFARTLIGGALRYAFPKDSPIKLYPAVISTSLAWRHDWVQSSSDVNLQNLGAHEQQLLTSLEEKRDAGFFQVGVSTRFKGNVHLGFSYSGLFFASKRTSNMLSVTLGIQW